VTSQAVVCYRKYFDDILKTLALQSKRRLSEMKTSTTRSLGWHELAWLPVRVAALAEVLVLPAALGYWVYQWHPPTPGVRLLLGCVLAYWAAKRAYRAATEPGSIQWRWTRLAAAVLAVWALVRLTA
jgi:hypothetical protein